MDKIENILSQMTLEEKAALCSGATAWTNTPIPSLGVPEMFVADGPHGVRKQPAAHELAAASLPATCFPTASLLAATWDVDLIQSMGKALAEECKALNVDVLLGPGANMKRSPLCGRNFEYYSEDPYLAGEMAAALINGVQNQGVGTSLKHFAANNQEYQRQTIDAQIDERALREIYLPAFEKAVKTAKPWTVMCSYNKLNGTLVSQNHSLLTDILKHEWGFEGMVVSDWTAVRDQVAALQAGLDWEMPGPQPYHVQQVIQAVKNGTLEMSVLDEAARRILKTVFKAAETPKGTAFDVDQHHELARQIAAEGIVLLKNNGILPLKPSGKIAVIGRSAKHAHFQGGGSSHINPTRVAEPLHELQKAAPAALITWTEGYPEDDSTRPELIDQAVSAARQADLALLYIALPTFKESEGYDRADLDLTTQQVRLIQAVSQVQPNCVVILNNGAPVVVESWQTRVAAILEAYMMGQAGGAAIADVLFGRVNPSGKLAETFPQRLEDTPSYLNFPGEAGAVRYAEGLYIGYRHYEAKKISVSYPFGHGLSYTTFAYANPSVDHTTFKDVDGLNVSVDITNIGKVAGKEIVQLYVRDQKSSLQRPLKELKGFTKVELQPGETKTVTLPLDFRAFAFYHPRYKQWVTEDGQFDLLIGASSQDIRATLTVTLQSTLELPCILNAESTVSEWLSDPRGRQALEPFYAMAEAKARQRFGSQDRYPDKEKKISSMGMNDIMDMVNEMPLVSVFNVLALDLGTSHEEIVAGLLAQAHSLTK